MAVPRVRLDHAAISQLLKSQEFKALTKQAADRVASAAGGRSKGAFVREYVTDRAAAVVLVPAVRQARSGALTRAAAQVGLEVRARG